MKRPPSARGAAELTGAVLVRLLSGPSHVSVQALGEELGESPSRVQRVLAGLRASGWVIERASRSRGLTCVGFEGPGGLVRTVAPGSPQGRDASSTPIDQSTYYVVNSGK